MVVVHGLGEHAGRYAEMGQYLGDRGFRVAAVTLPGHGPDARLLGIHRRRRTLRRLAHTIGALLASASSPASPLFVFGHSLGAQLVVRLAGHSRREGATLSSAVRSRLAGIILSSPFFGPAPVRFLLPKVPLALRSARGLTPDGRRRLAQDVADDAPCVEALVGDRALHGAINPCAFWLTQRRLRRLARHLGVPLLMGTARDERVVSPRRWQTFVDALSPGLRVHHATYDARHELHQCRIRHQWFQLIGDWIEEILAERHVTPTAG